MGHQGEGPLEAALIPALVACFAALVEIESADKSVRREITALPIIAPPAALSATPQPPRSAATDAAGTVRKFIADDEAHFFPIGTANTFRTYFAPADFNETANTLGARG